MSHALKKMQIDVRTLVATMTLGLVNLMSPIPFRVLLPSIAITVILGILLQYKLVNRILQTAKNGQQRLSRCQMINKVAVLFFWGSVFVLVMSIFESTPEQRQQSAIFGNMILVIGLAIGQSAKFGYVRYEEYRKEIDPVT